MRALLRAAAIAGWTVLGLVTAAGLALSAFALLAAAPFTRPLVASRLVRIADEAIAGHLDLTGVAVLPHGGLELRDLRVFDPDGHLVLSVGRARVFLDVTALRNRTVGVQLELDAPAVLLEQEPGGGVSLARAFAPTHPSAPVPQRAERTPWDDLLGGWTLLVSRLELRRAEIWWKDGDGATRLEASGIDLSARGAVGPRRLRAELRLRADVREPVASPVSLQVVASRTLDAVRVPVLELEAGGTALSAVAEGDLGRRTGRLAVTRLGVSRSQARALVPGAPAGADLAGVGFATSDGTVVTAALRVEPVPEGAQGGRGDAAVAAHLASLRQALGFDVVLDHVDPSRLAASAPAGDLTLTARGALGGLTLDDARGRLALDVARSTLRGGEVDRLRVAARARSGTLEVERLSGAAPGLSVEGAGRWRRGGPVSGTLTVGAADLAAAARNTARLAGTSPPPLAGRARVVATLGGTSDAPTVAGTLDAPLVRAGAVTVEGARLAVRAAGPTSAPEAGVDGRISRVSEGGRDLARQLSLRATLARGEASVSATGAVPAAGKEPLGLEARARVDAARRTAGVSQLALSYPGARWALVRPAQVDLRGPTVDRLELAAELQRLAVSGGLGPRGALDARLEATRLDLARLPAGLLPAGVGGEVDATVQASGAVAKPVVTVTARLDRGKFRNLSGLSAQVSARWDGPLRRASGTVAAARADGGAVDVAADLPLPLAGRGGERLDVRARAAALPVTDLLRAAGSDVVAAGRLGLAVRLAGTAGAPALGAEATLEDGVYEDLDRLGAQVSVEAAGTTARAVASGSIAGRRVVGVDGEVPLVLAELLARPAETARGVARAPLHGALHVTTLDLAAVSGKAGVPEGLVGLVNGRITVSGAAVAPRGQATLDVTGAAVRRWRGLGAHVEVVAAASGLTATTVVTAGGADALRVKASLGLAPERLRDRRALLAAPLRVDGEVPPIALGRAAGQVLPLEGMLEGKLAVSGTLAAPVAALDAAGRDVTVEGHPLGEASATARYDARRATAEVALRPRAGGSLRATLALGADLGLGAGARRLADAPAEATLLAEAVDLGVLPALLPGTVRTASGKLSADVHAAGPLARLRPVGEVHVAGARLAVAELGEWTDVSVDVKATVDAFTLARLEVHRGKGKLTATAAVTGIRSPQAKVGGAVNASGFTVARAGMDLATIDLEAALSGTYRPGQQLAVDVNVPRGVVRLPRKTPRTLQPLEERKDIVVGRRPEKKKPAAVPAAAAAGSPFEVTVHVTVPRNFFVKSDSPKIDVELKADVTYDVVGGDAYPDGTVEVVRGQVEPINGRNFVLDHGRVRFTGGPPSAALLDVEAKYTNPAAVVTVNVAGTVSKPEIRLTSNPPMDEAQIAMLIATGRTELKAGGGAVGSVTGQEAGIAAIGAVATQAFRNLVQDRLPLDTVAVDAGSIRAGKYLTDKIYVGYLRRFDADPTKAENEDEVRVEYQITPRWMFESRYGNAQSGGASLIWSKDY
jgi:translocation and assembly module TamB